MKANFLLVIYGIGYLYTFWRIGGYVAWKTKFHENKPPDTSDYLWGYGFIAPFAAAIWPFALPVVILVEEGVKGSRWSYVPKIHRQQLEEYKQQEQEQYIEELERKVGIR